MGLKLPSPVFGSKTLEIFAYNYKTLVENSVLLKTTCIILFSDILNCKESKKRGTFKVGTCHVHNKRWLQV